MDILIVGSGGREHALAWKTAQSPDANHIFVANGNAGTALESNITNIDINPTDIEQLATFAKDNNIELTIVGPEAPLAAGITDYFNQHNLACFGPTQAAAQLESSKAYSKAFMQRHNIPTASYAVFTDAESAIDHLKTQNYPLVIKADGLAAGKGVIIADDLDTAIAAANDMLSTKRFGEAGSRVVVESFLEGEEISFIVMCDGKNVLPLATSQDHKACFDGDIGPNTGGMGAYSPAPLVTDALHQTIMNTVILPTVEGMAKDGHAYTGFLYAGLMIAPDGTPNVLEYNCRFGDPETQPIMMRMKSDLAKLCLAGVKGTLDQTEIEWDERTALGVVLASGGYPKAYRKGDVISGLNTDLDKDCKVFHAGTAIKEQQIITAGGRVLCVTALGNNVSQAQQKAYKIVSTIDWPDMFYRHDIGHRGIALENQQDVD